MGLGGKMSRKKNEAAILVRLGIEAMVRWPVIGRETGVIIIDKDQRELTLFVSSYVDTEDVVLEHLGMNAQDFWMGYGPRADTLVIADPE
jgi:hypothetical protein